MVHICFGAPVAVLALEVLAEKNIKAIVAVGLAGSIHPTLKISDILLPTWAIRTNYHYAPPDYIPKPSEELLAKFEERIKANIGGKKINIVRGGVWTTDTPPWETRDLWSELRMRGRELKFKVDEAEREVDKAEEVWLERLKQ